MILKNASNQRGVNSVTVTTWLHEVLASDVRIVLLVILLVPESLRFKSSLNASVVLPRNFLKFYNSKMKHDIFSLLTPCDRSFLKESGFR